MLQAENMQPVCAVQYNCGTYSDVIKLKAMIKDLLFSKEGEQEKPLAEPAGGQGTTTTEIPISENLTRAHLIKITREDLMQQSTPKSSYYLGFGKHRAKTYQEVQHVNHEYCRSIDHVADQQSHWELNRFLRGCRCRESTRNRIWKNQARGGEPLRRNASVERTRQTPRDTRTERSQLDNKQSWRRKTHR